MKKNLRQSLLLFAVVAIFFSATDEKFNFLNSIPFSQEVQFTTDPLGNAFVVVENQLLQFDTIGKPKANFSESSFGTIRTIDVSDPLKILLFYPDFAKIILLDSKLAFQTSIDLRTVQINQPLAVCNSEENGFWIYDREDELLKKIDMNLKVIHRSGNLTQVVGYQVQPLTMMEYNGFIYMNNPTTGILIFDRYGEYYKTLPYKKLKTFQVIGKEILVTRDGKLLRVDIKTAEEKEVLIPAKDSILSARIERHELYLLTTDSLKFYSF